MKNKPVIIFGAGGLGLVAVDMFKLNGIDIYGILDDDIEKHNTMLAEVPVIGDTNNDTYLKLLGENADAFLALEDVEARRITAEMLMTDHKIMPINGIHSRAWLAPSVSLGHGIMADAGVNIHSGCFLGNHVHLSAGVTLSDSCKIGDFAFLGPGTVLSPNVSVGKFANIGPGVTIARGVNIGDNAMVGPGSVVLNSVAEGETVFGVPAKKL